MHTTTEDRIAILGGTTLVSAKKIQVVVPNKVSQLNLAKIALLFHTLFHPAVFIVSVIEQDGRIIFNADDSEY